MIHYDKCPVCGSARIQKVLVAKDHTVSQQLFEIWQCAHCSVRFTQGVPGASQIGEFYKSEQYISHTETSKGLVNSLYLRVRKITIRSKKNFIEQQTGLQKGSILDIGAGTGAFVHFMQQHGWTATGLEPDEQAIARAAAQYNLVLKPSGELFQLREKEYDVITMWHVLEHVHALHEYLDRIKMLLKENGKLFVAVPNYTSHDAEHYQEHWAAYDVPRHLYHFSPASMHELAKMHGFTISKWQPMWFDSFYVSMLSEKYKRSSLGIFKAFIAGMQSNSKAFSNVRKASSLVYVMGNE